MCPCWSQAEEQGRRVQADRLAELPHLRDGQVGPAVPEAGLGLDVVPLGQAGTTDPTPADGPREERRLTDTDDTGEDL